MWPGATARPILLVALLLLLSQPAPPIAAAPRPQGSGARARPRADLPRWTRLCNGRDLSGWEVVNAGNWTVEEGAIVVRRVPGHREGGWLVTRKDYADFVLRLKFKPASEAFNSGVLIRDPGHAKVSRPAFNGFEIKLAQGDDRDDNTNAAIWNAANAYFRKISPREWTSLEVKCTGDHMVTSMNGRKMAETHSRRSYKGAIGLHLHGGDDQPEYRWKDIEILELPEAARTFQLAEERLEQAPGTFTPLFPGDSLETGFLSDAATKAVWTMREGVLLGSNAGEELALVTKQSYADFILSFDFKVSAGGDAGVLLRLPDRQTGAERKALAGQGYEFHIADTDRENPSGSVYQLARAFILDSSLQRIYRPGKWNTARVYATGDHVVTYVNLVKTAEVHSNRRLRGRIGFRVGPGAAVEYRDVRIKAVG